MIKTEDFDIVGSYNNQRVSEIDAERTVNMFEYIDPLGKKPKTLINTSGLIDTETNFGAITGGFRAQFVFQAVTEDQYLVIGSSIFKISSTNIVSLIGTLVNTTVGYVGIDANSFQIIFVDGVDGYIWDTIANIFTPITDPAFPVTPIDVCTLDNFFVVANGNTNQFQLSMLDQGLVWGPDNSGTPSTFTMAVVSADIVITYATGGSISNYQIGTPIVFTGGGLPVELVAGTTYYVVAIVNPTTIRVSATDGGTAITSTLGGAGSIENNGQLQQGEITTHPGTIVACRTLHRKLFLFSQFFTEVWENAGIGTNLPFRRNNTLLMEYGTPAIGSIAVGFDLMCFLSQARDGLGPVMQVSGTQAAPISNRALDFQYSQYAALNQVSDCRAFLIKENGLIFYRMNFTAANHTFIYSITFSDPSQEQAKLWHEEEVLNGDRHPAQTHAYFNGNNYVGDYALPLLYKVSSTTFKNNNEEIRRMRISRAFTPPGYQRTRIDRFQIDLLQGNIAELGIVFAEVPLLTENNFDILTEADVVIILEQEEENFTTPVTPYVFLSISRDGGQTYGYTIKAPMGLVGHRSFRTVWRKLGTIPRGQGFVVKLEFFDQIPFILLGASWAREIMPE